MIKEFKAKTCAFDVEWVPCAESGRRLLRLEKDMPEADIFKAMWAHYRKEGDGPDVQPFLKLVMSKVVSIAAVIRDVHPDGRVELKVYSRGVDEVSEGKMIQQFLEGVAGKEYQLWGYNSAGADVPILMQRAIALGVELPNFSKRPNKPWQGMDYHDARNSEAHVDIMNAIGGYGGSSNPKLAELAAVSGVPGKLDTDGGQVAQVYLVGKVREIVAYNETDALTTHLLMLRVALTGGFLSREKYLDELTAVDALLAEGIQAGKEHFRQFRAVWYAQQFDRDAGALPVVG